MKRNIFITAALLLGLLFAPIASAHAQTTPVVHAVLFYSPTCGHCEYVINEILPPLIEKYGDQLQIVGVNVAEQQGSTLFLAALDQFKLEEAGVPFLVISDKYLMGSADIPEQLPGLIETYLKQGGVDFPDIPGLREAMRRRKTPRNKPRRRLILFPQTLPPRQISPCRKNSPSINQATHWRSLCWQA